MGLKPCPFCGSKPNGPDNSDAGDERRGYNFTATIGCPGCGASISAVSHKDDRGWCNDIGQAHKKVIGAWNKRAPTQ